MNKICCKCREFVLWGVIGLLLIVVSEELLGMDSVESFFVAVFGIPVLLIAIWGIRALRDVIVTETRNVLYYLKEPAQDRKEDA